MSAPSTSISMSASAAKQINAIMAKQKSSKFLRVAVNGGGCSGFQYAFDFADAPNEDDLILELDGAKILIDEISQEFLKDSEIDYVQELIGSAFKIHNPNAKAACGCGVSFSM